MDARHKLMTTANATRQVGIVLPIVLIFLVLMTLIGVTAIRNVTMEEKMAGNSRNYQIAFQSAEEALRYCEGEIIKAGVVPAPTTGPFYKDQPVPSEHFFPDKSETEATKFWKTKWSDAQYTVTVPIKKDVAANTDAPDFATARPVCMVERLKFPPGAVEEKVTTCPFRVTAQGFGGANSAAVVVLQSYVNVPAGKWNNCG